MKDKKPTYQQKKKTNYWWSKIVLTPYKNGIPKNCKPTRYNVPRFFTKNGKKFMIS